jgi:hypothetical protein
MAGSFEGVMAEAEPVQNKIVDEQGSISLSCPMTGNLFRLPNNNAQSKAAPPQGGNFHGKILSAGSSSSMRSASRKVAWPQIPRREARSPAK